MPLASEVRNMRFQRLDRAIIHAAQGHCKDQYTLAIKRQENKKWTDSEGISIPSLDVIRNHYENLGYVVNIELGEFNGMITISWAE